MRCGRQCSVAATSLGGMTDFLKAAITRVVNEPVAVVAGLIAVLTATTDTTWKGYAVAAGVFLLRFVVTGPSTAKVLTKKADLLSEVVAEAVKPTVKTPSLIDKLDLRPYGEDIVPPVE